MEVTWGVIMRQKSRKKGMKLDLDFFNPLKIINNNKDVIRNLDRIIPNEKIFVPETKAALLHLPLCRKRGGVLNFNLNGVYNFWNVLKLDSKKLSETAREFASYDNIEMCGLFEENISFANDSTLQAVFLLFMSRACSKNNVTGGPYDVKISECLSEEFLKRLKSYSLHNIEITNEDPNQIAKAGFVLQTIPKIKKQLFGDNKEERFYLDLLKNIKRGVVISFGNKFLTDYQVIYKNSELEVIYIQE